MLACLSIMNYVHSKSYLYPPVIFSTVWAFLLLGLVLSGQVFYPLSFLALTIFFFGALAFSIGGLTALHITTHQRSADTVFSLDYGKSFINKVLNLGLVAQLAIAPLYFRQLKAMSSQSGAESLMVGVRLLTVLGTGKEASFGVFAYLIAIVTFLALVAFYECDDTFANRARAALYILIALVYQIMSASRTGAVLAVISLVIIAIIKSGRIRLRTAVAGVVVFLLVFSIPAVLLNKGGSLEQTVAENFYGIAESVRNYTLPSLVAFDQTLVAAEPSGKLLSFRFFYALAHALGAKIDVPSPILEYTYTPLPTNVYTMYYFFYSDFGLAGTAIVMFALGILCTCVYLYAMNGEPRGVFLYAMVAASLILSGLNEPFLSAASFWIQAVLFVFIIYCPMLNRMFRTAEK
jgi:oligosaccharide repeat unit polymerase